MSLIYLGVGSNLGDRFGQIEQVRSLLDRNEVRVLRISPLYETAALLRFDASKPQPPYINGVFEAETILDPEALLSVLERIERMMGRTGKGDWEPRSMDLDVLFYADRCVETERLRVPHPGIPERWFVLKPLADLVPDMVHPITKKTVRELLDALSPPKGERVG